MLVPEDPRELVHQWARCRRQRCLLEKSALLAVGQLLANTLILTSRVVYPAYADADLLGLCHPGCSGARLAREGWPVPCRRMLIRTPSGRQLVSVSTISVRRDGEQPVVLNLLRNCYSIEPTKKAAQS